LFILLQQILAEMEGSNKTKCTCIGKDVTIGIHRCKC